MSQKGGWCVEGARKGAGGRCRGGRRTHGEGREKEGSWGHRACRRVDCASEGEGVAGHGRRVNFKLVSDLPESGRSETQLEIHLPSHPLKWGQ